jgi:GNAT superfamily N-acetyltransferase
LTEDAARYLIVRDASGKIVAFAHFRFTLHGELADCMEGTPCLFVYDIHVDDSIKRKGVAKHLMVMLELIARKVHTHTHTILFYYFVACDNIYNCTSSFT